MAESSPDETSSLGLELTKLRSFTLREEKSMKKNVGVRVV